VLARDAADVHGRADESADRTVLTMAPR
jgi:hypothetical protein